jgi:hypothetical protein
MRRRLATLALSLLPLGGCGLPAAAFFHSGGLVAAGASAGWLATAVTVDKEVDLGFEAVQPLNKAICVVELAKPHNAEVQAAMAAFCGNLPDSVSRILVQAAAVAVAIEAEKSATAARAAP